MKVEAIIQLIQDDGWVFDRQKGRLVIYKHPDKDDIVSCVKLWTQ